MRRIIVLMMLPVFLSCTELPVETVESRAGERETVSFCVRVDGTKTLDPSEVFKYETAVGSVCFLVFDNMGRLEARLSSDEPLGRTEAVITYGRKTVWAFANIDDKLLEGIKSEEDLKSFPISLSDHKRDSGGGFPMTGMTDAVVPSGSGDVVVDLSRLVSRVSIGHIRNSLTGSLSDCDIRLKCAYLSNVSDKADIFGNAGKEAGIMNRNGRPDGCMTDVRGIESARESFCGDLTWADISKTLVPGGVLDVRCPLYFFPGRGGSDSCTKIVLTAEIKGNTYYYPVNISSLGRNESANVDLTITHLGSLDPDRSSWAEEIKVSKSSASVVAGVSDAVILWNEGLGGEELYYTVSGDPEEISTSGLSWEMTDTLWHGRNCKALRFSTSKPIDKLNPPGKSPDYLLTHVSVCAKNAKGEQVAMPSDISVRVYHEAFPILLSLRQDPGEPFWYLYASGNNPLELGFSIDCRTYRNDSPRVDYSFQNHLVRLEDSGLDIRAIGLSPVKLGTIGYGTFPKGVWIDLKIKPVTGPVFIHDNPDDMAQANWYEVPDPKFSVSDMYMGEGTGAWFGPGSGLAPGVYPQIGDFSYRSVKAEGVPVPGAWNTFSVDFSVGGVEAFSIDGHTTGWNRSGNYDVSRFVGCPFYFVNAGMEVVEYVLHNDKGAIMTDDGRIGVEVFALEPGRDLGVTAEDSKARFGALLGIQRRVVGSDKVWLAWRKYDYSIYLTINGCSCWPGGATPAG